MSQNHPFNEDDESFYKAHLNEMSNIEAVIKPQINQVLQQRGKVNNLRVSLASLAVCEMIEFKDATETQDINKLLDRFGKKDKELKTTREFSNNAKYKSADDQAQ